ncbi:MAG: EamA family transporter [Chloroflexi bacterium]|nr:EamA family transporter [Chloroflexota bacterium]
MNRRSSVAGDGRIRHYLPHRDPTAGWLIWAALLVVYVVWGSTYLAIAVMVDTLPPLLAAGIRFLIAGALLVGWLLLRGGRSAVSLTGRQLAACAVIGTALLASGNGVLSVAQRDVPSALAALLIASVPLWVVVLRLLLREQLRSGVLWGVVLGFVGVAALVLSNGLNGDIALPSLLLVVLASMSWATGSVFSRRLPLPSRPLLTTAVQMLCGGAVLVVVSVVIGEAAAADPSAFAIESIVALGYLVVFGSIVAYTAYTWLLQNAPISTVATYAYVNPVVAVLLGWALLQEDITVAMLLGAVMILGAVAFIVRSDSRSPSSLAPDVPEPAPTPLRS